MNIPTLLTPMFAARPGSYRVKEHEQAGEASSELVYQQAALTLLLCRQCPNSAVGAHLPLVWLEQA